MLFKCTLKHFHDVLPGYFGVSLKIALEINPELIVYPQITGTTITLCFTEEKDSHIACVASTDRHKHVAVVTVTKVLPPGFDIKKLGERII